MNTESASISVRATLLFYAADLQMNIGLSALLCCRLDVLSNDPAAQARFFFILYQCKPKQHGVVMAGKKQFRLILESSII